jgi:diguanylate cyclase (GGDEF)-like protein/PAS domain S-box-containing protein
MRHLIFPLTLTVALLSLGVFVYGAYLHSIPVAPTIALTAHTKTITHARRARPVSAKLLPGLIPGLPTAEGSFKLMQCGGIGLILSVFLALGLARSVLSTQFATAQSFLKDERKAWEKKQSVYDAQRDQLISELQVAQTKKDEMDTLRQHASRQFQEFFQTLPVACFCFAPSGKIIRWNAACEQLYGISSATMLSSTLWAKVISPQEREATEGCVRRVLSGESLVDMVRQDRHAGGFCSVKSSMVPMHDADGTIIGILSASIGVEAVQILEPQVPQVSEVSEAPENLEAIMALEDTWAAIESARCALAKQQAESERLQPSLRDSVTGVWGHRAFHEHLTAEMERAARYHHPLTLVVVDLDNFVALNQTQGYEAGDTALCSVADLIKSKMRTVDVVARIGADGFAVILPETGQTGARMAAERIRAGIAGIGREELALTACVGISLLSPETLNTEMFLQQGLAALHEAKSRGADCIVQCGEAATSFAR